MATLSWLVGCLNYWQYFRVLHTPFTIWLSVFSIAALVFAFAVLRFRALALRGAWWSAVLAFPAIWVSYEYARNLMTPHGTAGCVAYSPGSLDGKSDADAWPGLGGCPGAACVAPACSRRTRVSWRLRRATLMAADRRPSATPAANAIRITNTSGACQL